MSSEPLPPSVYTPFLRRFTDEPARDLADTIALYHEVQRTHADSVWAQEDIVERINARCVEVITKLIDLPNSARLLEALDKCQKAIIAQETTIISFPEIDWSRAHLSMKEQVDLRRFLRAKQHFLANEDRNFELFALALCNVFGGIIQDLPALPDGSEAKLTVPLVSLLPKPGVMIDKIIGTLLTEPLVDAGLFRALQQRFYENQCRASDVQLYAETKRPLVDAEESELGPEELVATYFAGTPFVDLFKTPVQFVLPASARFEHHWIVGGSGHGKTNALMISSWTTCSALRTARVPSYLSIHKIRSYRPLPISQFLPKEISSTVSSCLSTLPT